MHFGENQLSRSLIGLSPLPTAHPPSFQPRWVRSSTRSYTCFNLAMGRSPRFGSRPCHYGRPFGLALATAPPNGLTSRHGANSQAHSSIGTPSPAPATPADQALTACERPVSGTVSLPSRGTFHHSLTVLVRYRSSGGIQAAEWSRRIHTGFHVPRATRGRARAADRVPPTGLSPAAAPRPRGFGYPTGFSLRPAAAATGGAHPATPRAQPPPGHRTRAVSAIIRFRSPLLTEYPLLRVLRCFTSPRHPPRPMNFGHG